jgi:DNA repair exonuclease SbcCD ATPase subunit
MTEYGRLDVNLSSKNDIDARKRAIADARKEMGTTTQQAEAADRLAEQIFARQDRRVAKSNASNKQLQKSTDDVNAADQRSIELKNRLIKLHRDYEKVQEERGRKSSIRSKKELQATIDEATILKEILAINEELGAKNDRLEKRYAKLRASIESYTDKLEQAVRGETKLADVTETTAKATEKRTATSKKAAEATKELSDGTSQLSLNLENLVNSTGNVDKAEEILDNNREHRTRRQEARDKKAAGGGGGRRKPPVDGGGGGDGPRGPVPPMPGGGDEDFEWDKYLEKIRERIKQLIVEQGSAEGRYARQLADELRQLDKREQFARRANELEIQRSYAVQKIGILQRELEKETAGSRSYQKIEAAIVKINTRVGDANRALAAGTGNADSLVEALQKVGVESSLILDKAEQERLARSEALSFQSDYLDAKRDELNKEIDALKVSRDSLTNLAAKKQIEDKINEALRVRRTLQLQIFSSELLSLREFDRLQTKLDDLKTSFSSTAVSAADDDRAYQSLIAQAQSTYETRVGNLRKLRDEASDPSVIRSLTSEINSAERTLDELNRKFSDGRGTIEGLTDVLERAGFRAEQLLEITDKQNETFVKNRAEAEAFTRGLNTDIRTQRLILDRELARTESLKARALIQKALNDLLALEEKRRRDIDRGTFSDDQALALQVETQRVFRRNINDREEAVRVEQEYNRELDKTNNVIKELNLFLNDRDPLFKAGFSTNEIDKLQLALAKLKDELADAGRAGKSIDDISRRVNTFGRNIDAARAPLNKFELALSRLRDRFSFLDRIFGKLDASTRGFSLFTTLATLAVEPLAAVVLQLSAGLVAVASSAIGAGAALGGALVAGAAQALPVLALLGAGFKSLIDVVQISNRQKQDTASNAAREARGVGGAATAANTLKNSQDSLTEAQRRLNEARREAIRDLEDLADKEKQAELAARSATISVVEAQIALDTARNSGSALDIRRAEIELAGSRISERQSERDLGRTQFDSARTRGRGVEGSEQVVSAKRALAQAERALAQARVSGASAADNLRQSTALLDEQIKRLSPGQRELLENVNQLRNVFRAGPFVEIRDIILQPFNSAIDALKGIGKDTGITGSFTALAESISKTLGAGVDKVFGPSSTNFIKFINGEAAANIETVGSAFGSIGSILAKIATGAAPLLRDVLNTLAGGLERINNSLTDTGLEEFFDTVGDSLEVFGQLTEETFILLKNLFELSSPAGNTLVSTFATFIRGINQQLANPTKRREITDWFNEVGKGVAAFGRAFADIGNAIFKGLEPTRLRQFSTFLSEVVAPAIRNLIVVSQIFADVLQGIGRLPLAGDLAALAISTVVLGKTFATVAGLAGLLRTGLRGLIATYALLTAAQTTANVSTSLGATVFGSAGTSTGTLGQAAGKTATSLGRMAGLRGAMVGLGRAISVLGPFGLAAGIGLTLFGDKLIGLLPGLESIEDRAKKAKTALIELASVGDEKTRNDLDKRQAINDRRAAELSVREALATRDAARERLDAASTETERKEARRALESANIQLTNSRLNFERSKQSVKDIEKTIQETSDKADAAAKNAAAAVGDVFTSSKFKAVASGPKGGVTLQLQTAEVRQQQLRDLLGNDKDFQALEEYTKGKIQGILEMILREKGSIPPDQLEIVFKGIADNKSFAEIVKDIGLKVPKNYNIAVEFDQKKLEAEAKKAGTTVDALFLSKIDRINQIVAAQSRTDADRGRSLPGFADGGIIPAQRGGRIIRVAEDGHDEYVITTDPTKRDKSRQLLNRVARSLQLPNGDEKNYGVSEGDPPSLRGRGRSGGAGPSMRNPLAGFFTMFNTAKRLDGLDIPYSWGGGHTTPARPTAGIKSDGKDGRDIVGLDCSSSVSAVLQSAIPSFPTITSGDFPSQSAMAPGRGLVTVWSNNKHVFMSFGDEDWGTNSGEPGNGPGFHDHSKGGYRATHPKALGRATKDSSVFGNVYRGLADADLSGMDSLSTEFSSLGRNARSFKPGGGNLFSAAAGAVLGSAFKNFQQFQNGGTVQGRKGAAVPIIAHSGEMIFDPETSKSIKDGRGSRELVAGFLNAIQSAIKGSSETLRKAFTQAFENVGIGIQDISKKKGMQGGLINNIVVDNRPGKKGGESSFNILDAAIQAIRPGGKDEDFKAVAGTTNKRIKTALEGVSDRFAGFLERVRNFSQGFINTAEKRIGRSNDRIAATQQFNSGTFDEATGLVNFGTGNFNAQAFDSVEDIRAGREELVGQRTNLVAARVGIQGLINSTTDTLGGLEAKLRSLNATLPGLEAEKAKILKMRPGAAKQKKLAAINALIKAVDDEIDSTESQISSTKSTIAQLNDDLGSTNAQIVSTESNIQASQGAEIDALIGQATSGRYGAQEAEKYLVEAETLARNTNDQQRLAAIRSARFNLGQNQAGAQIGEAQAKLRAAERSGDEGGRRTALQDIGTILAGQQAATQKEIDRLVGEGLDPNSQEMIALRTRLIELGIAIQDNTDALNGTTTQNFSSSAWQFFRRAIFGGENQILPGFQNSVASATYATQVVPQAAVGAMVMADGLLYAHKGEKVIPAMVSRNLGDLSTQNISVTVNEAQQSADPTYLAKRLAFELQGR